MRFAERHRRLLNALVAARPDLLGTSLALLLRAPKLLDFDNKRVLLSLVAFGLLCWGWALARALPDPKAAGL